MAEAKQINRSVYGQYGLTQIDGFEVPYLSASQAEQLANPGERWANASHHMGSYIRDLGWSGNSFSNALSRGAAAFGLEKKAISPTANDGEGGWQYSIAGYTGVPLEPVSGYQITGDLQGLAQKLNIDTSSITPYEKEVTGSIYGTSGEGNWPQVTGTGVIKTAIRDADGNIREYKPVTRTVSVEEQLYDKVNEATKDYYSYTGDTLVPGQASEGGPNSFQTVLYKKEGDVLKPLTAPVSHGGWQNADVYTGGSGFKLGELLRGIAPVAAFAIGAPFLDAALFGASAGAAAAGGGAAGGTAAGTGLTGGFGGSTGLLASGGTVGSLGGAGSAAGIAGTQAAAGLGVAAGSALPAVGMATGGLPSTVGQLSAALPAPGSVGGAGMGLSAELAPGTILGSGLPGGGAIGASYALGPNGLPATNLLGQPIQASSIGFGDIPSTVTSGLNISIKDALDVARIGRGLLGGQQQPQQQAAARTPQSIMPRGQVDYSGILNLLQVPSPQRNMYSLLG
jgi:hypothetical protein